MQVFIHACRKVNGRWQNVRVAVRVAVSIQFFVLAVQLSSVCCYTHSWLWCCASHVLPMYVYATIQHSCRCCCTQFVSMMLVSMMRCTPFASVMLHTIHTYDAVLTIRVCDAIHTICVGAAAYTNRGCAAVHHSCWCCYPRNSCM